MLSLMELWTFILQIRVRWNVWSPKVSIVRPHGQIWVVEEQLMGSQSFRLIAMSKIKGGRRFDGLLRHNAMIGYDVCGDRMLGRRWRCSGAWL
jgi:hypothetical protein